MFNYRAKRRILTQPSGTCRVRLTNRKSNEVAVLPFDLLKETNRQTDGGTEGQTDSGMVNVISIPFYMCWALVLPGYVSFSWVPRAQKGGLQLRPLLLTSPL